jgi:hypothetical protein
MSFASYAAPSYGYSAPVSYAHPVQYAAAPVQYAAAPAPAPAPTYPGPNGKGWDVEEQAAGTEISPEICAKIGVPVGSKWGPAPSNPYPAPAPAPAPVTYAAPVQYASIPTTGFAAYPSNYSTVGPSYH